MALVGKTEGYAIYVKQFKYEKIWIEPNMPSNGTWMSDGYSCRGSGLDELSDLYKVFNGTHTSYLNKFNKGAWIEICLPQATEVAGCYMTSSDGFFPATGDIYYSDDGESYIKCGSWTDTSNSENVTAYVTKGSGAHRIWRFMSTGRASAHPSANADVSVAKLFTEEHISVDNTLPEGMGGYSNPYVIHKLHNGLDMRKLEVYFTYKQDDKINIWEGTDNVPVMTGLTQSYITNRPHDGLDIRNLESYIRYRPHDGLDIRKLETYFLYKQEDKVDTFKIPYGIGGFTTIFILERIKGLVGYLNDINVSKVQGIALGSNYFNLKDIQKFNMVPFFNNNTTDTGEGDTDDS